MLAELSAGSSLAVEAFAGLALFIAAVTFGRLLKRRAGVPLGFLYLLFCAVLAVWLPLEFFPGPYTPLPSTLRGLRAAAILCGTLFIIAVVRRYYWELWFEKHQKTKAPKFLSQLFGLVLFLAALLVVIGGIYGHSIEGVIFGSTIIVGIIGFAMQDLLGNIIAGIALELGKPFKTGDWLIFENQRAEVIEVNWRSTKLRNNDDVYLDIPNKAIAGSTIINLTYPTRQHALRLDVHFDYGTPPNRIKDAVIAAAAQVPGVLVTPPPKAFLKHFAESAVTYEIKFWIEDESKYNDIVDGIRTNVWYAARRLEIRMPFPIRTIQIERPGRRAETARAATRATIREQPLLQLLDDAEAERMLTAARQVRFGRGERIIRQGDAGESMFILLEGEAEVLVRAGDHETRVAMLRPGDYCGEMSLLTGEPRSATVLARRDCELLEIAKPLVAELLQKNETLVAKLGEMLAQRRMETEGIVASEMKKPAHTARHREYAEGFIQKLYAFFEL